jgi:hypothetical protein
MKTVFVDKMQYFLVFSRCRFGQGIEKAKDLISPTQMAAGQLPDDEWMAKDGPLVEKLLQPGVVSPEVVNPN